MTAKNVQEKDYNKQFNTATYLQKFCTNPFSLATSTNATSTEDYMWRFFLENVHSFYTQTHPFSPNSAVILELGGGPTLAYLISAAPFATEIIFAEYLPSNREAVRKWKDSEASCHDWGPFIEHVVISLEGHPNAKEAILARTDEIRRKLSTIIPCNLKKEKPIGEEYKATFDVVSTTLCFECVAQSCNEFKGYLSEIAYVLKPGGWISMNGVTGGSFYYVGDEKFPNCCVSEDEVMEMVRDAGFGSIQMNHRKELTDPAVSGFLGYYHIHAQLK